MALCVNALMLGAGNSIYGISQLAPHAAGYLVDSCHDNNIV